MKNLAYVVVFLALIVVTLSAPTNTHQLSEKNRQEIAMSAARILRLVMDSERPVKRGGGVVDSLWTLPDLARVGRK